MAKKATAPRGRAAWLWREWIKPAVVALVVVGSFRSAFADWNDVPSGSMKPTILIGDRIFVNRMAYDVRVPFTKLCLWHRADPARGDIVIFPSPENGKRLVKRIVGVPGDVIQLSHNRLVVNGKVAEYDVEESGAVRETVEGRTHDVAFLGGSPRETFGPVRVPEGRYFMMGDNRDGSLDSRWFGRCPAATSPAAPWESPARSIPSAAIARASRASSRPSPDLRYH
ncbi:MAG: signal peptidase I [Acidobacteriota bacterium]